MSANLTVNQRYLTYALLFYCVIATLYWLPFVFSVKHRSRICQNLILTPDQQDTPPPRQNVSSPKATELPLKIWQTAKLSVSALEAGTQSTIQSWINHNPNHRFELLTDGSSESYVTATYAHKPEVVQDYLALQDPVLRADLLRYLILYGDGGIYTDLDTVCLRPFNTWVPAAFNESANLIIGIEGDSLGGPMIPGFSYHVGLGQATLAAKPGHVLIEQVMERVLSRLHMLAERQNCTLATIKASYMDVINTTGPGVFSACVYEHLSLVTGTNVTSGNLTRLTEPRLIGDVLILPVTAFTPGIGHSDSGNIDDASALVQHLFHGSWKPSHPSQTNDNESEGPESGESEDGHDGESGGKDDGAIEDATSPRRDFS